MAQQKCAGPNELQQRTSVQHACIYSAAMDVANPVRVNERRHRAEKDENVERWVDDWWRMGRSLSGAEMRYLMSTGHGPSSSAQSPSSARHGCSRRLYERTVALHDRMLPSSRPVRQVPLDSSSQLPMAVRHDCRAHRSGEMPAVREKPPPPQSHRVVMAVLQDSPNIVTIFISLASSLWCSGRRKN